jgi:hypothetical protein
MPFVVPLSDKALAKAIETLAADPASRVRLGRANRAVIAAHFRNDTMVADYRALFSSAAGAGSGLEDVAPSAPTHRHGLAVSEPAP